jgi:predicted anti-sigma-YlaC factor YlaD
MNCSNWEQEIAGESESVALEEHLRACGQCREFADELERNRTALRAVEIHPAAFDAVRLRVLDELRSKKQRRTWWAWSAVAAAACVAVLCASIVLQNWKNPAPPKPLVAAKDPLVMLSSIAPVQPVARAHQRVHHKFGPATASAGPAHNPEPLVVKMLTNDPNVIIIWLVDQKGDSL